MVTADERSCRDHNIPDHPKRYSAGVTTINNFLFVCAGYTGNYGCKKLDLNAENPSWSSFTSLPWRPYHYLLETVGDYMYAIGGYYGGTCYKYVYRITASGGSWEARANYPRNIHRHGGTVDKVKY